MIKLVFALQMILSYISTQVFCLSFSQSEDGRSWEFALITVYSIDVYMCKLSWMNRYRGDGSYPQSVCTHPHHLAGCHGNPQCSGRHWSVRCKQKFTIILIIVIVEPVKI